MSRDRGHNETPRAVVHVRESLRADLVGLNESTLSRAARIYAASTRATLVATVKRAGLSRKRVALLALMGAVMEADRLGEDDRAFEFRVAAALEWGGPGDGLGLESLFQIVEAILDYRSGPP